MKINEINQIRLKEILTVLYPEYRSIKITKSGIITMRRSKWSRVKINDSIFGLCILDIPQRISRYLGYQLTISTNYFVDLNLLIDYLYQLLLRRESYKHHSLIEINREYKVSVNSILTDLKNSRLSNGYQAKQIIKLLKESKEKQNKRLFGFSLLR